MPRHWLTREPPLALTDLLACGGFGDDVPTLTELRAKYGFDGGKYEPKPDCKFCKGAGERMVKTTPPRMTFCICLFVDHELSEFAGDSLADTARKLREEMERAR